MIRQAAAEKLARTLLEMRPSRIAPLSDEFYLAVAKIIMAHVALDEHQQRRPGAAYKELGRKMAHGGADMQPGDESTPQLRSDE